MTKRDIIRIINEEVNFALNEQEKQLYKVVDDKGKTIKPDESSDVDGLIKKIATKLAAKNPKWSVEKINEMYDPIYDSMIPEILVMISAGVIGVSSWLILDDSIIIYCGLSGVLNSLFVVAIYLVWQDTKHPILI